MVVVEGLIVIAIIAGIVAVARPAMRQRAERLKARDERAAKIEAAKSAEEVVQLMMLDREVAERVRDGLDRELKKPDRPE